jgi:hypothetical protein
MVDMKLQVAGDTIPQGLNERRLSTSQNPPRATLNRVPQRALEFIESASAEQHGDQILTRSKLRLGAILTALFVRQIHPRFPPIGR